MLDNVKKVLSYLRELIWPLLEPLEESTTKQISEIDCLWDDKETDVILRYAEKFYESEEERKREVESKSTIFIGTFGVATAILMGLTKDMIFSNTVPYTPFRSLLICMMTLAIIYLCRAIIFSINALERRNYNTMGFPNFMISNSEEKKKQIIIRQYNNTKKNSNEINIKVDYMTMAQEYFKRTIIIVILFSCIILINYIVSYKSLVEFILDVLKLLLNNQIFPVVVLIGILVFCILRIVNKIK